jgi:hypothetical protein
VQRKSSFTAAPPWRTAATAAAYVRSFVDLEGEGDATDADGGGKDYVTRQNAAAIQAALAVLIGAVVDLLPADEADELRPRLRADYIEAMVAGVERARTLHALIEYEEGELKAAQKAKRNSITG